MKKYAMAAFIYSTLILAGCGGGENNSVATPATKAVTAVYLFGNMSSTSKITSVQTSLTVPSGLLVNYSSPAPAGYPANTYPLKSGFAVPSGPVRVAEADITGTFNTTTRNLSIYLLNQGGIALKSGSTGNGTEIARINYQLAAAGVIPTLPSPWEDSAVIVGQELATLPTPSATFLPGCKLNFLTTYQ
jgi:hypothetical protein